MRRLTASLLEMAGFAAVSYGGFLLAVWLGWMLAGAAAVAVANALDARRAR